ncbi:MAG: hypothetical protein GXP53_01050 [Deltaproteobacteria bacterium]|nr:hypothetical protein [Deltaproteobacteria bacterium]
MTETNRTNTLSGFLPRVSIFYIMAMISLMMAMSALFKISWMDPGDYDFRTTMYFHGIMAPSLLLFYLLAVFITPVKELSGKGYLIAVMAAVFLLCAGSMFNLHKGLSFAAGIQISGFFLLDILGIILAAGLIKFYRAQSMRQKKAGIAILTLFSSVVFILMAGTLGHLLGWAQDLGINSIPGIKGWLVITGAASEAFMENVKTSHSHLIVAAYLCGLAALTAIRFGDEKMAGHKKALYYTGLWMMLAGITAAAGLYLVSALGNRDIPAVFISGHHGENGLALDDLILGMVLSGGALLLFGLAFFHDKNNPQSIHHLRSALFINWLCGFIGSVFIGYYIEFHETFFGGGELPAPGAANDLAFIRAHLLYSFMFLPLVFILILAIDLFPARNGRLERFTGLLPPAAIIIVIAGLCAEFVWVVTLNNVFFKLSMALLVLLIVSGTIVLYPRGLKKLSEKK